MTALASALQSAGIAPTEAPKKNGNHKKARKGRKWKSAQSKNINSITWENENVGTLAVSSSFRLGTTHPKNGYFFAQIYLRDHEPSFIDLDFTANLKEGVVPLFSQNGQVLDCGNRKIPSLRVPVKWQKGKGENRYPHTRERGKDNVDIYFVLPDGTFIVLQVSILTRGGNFYVCIQELYAGQVMQAELSDLQEFDLHYQTVEVGGKHYFVVPLWNSYAYPGADYLKVSPTSGPIFLKMAAENKAFEVIGEELQVPTWDAPPFPTEKGWPMGGVITFFNAIIGAKVLCADGVECYIPVGLIPGIGTASAMKEGDFPLLHPRQQVLLRFREGDKGRIANEIKPIPVPDDAD